MSMRAILLVNQGEFQRAASVSFIAADDPNAFFTTYAVAAACLQLVGESSKVRQHNTPIKPYRFKLNTQ